MNGAITLKSNFKPPYKLKQDNFILEALSSKHNKRDFIAWTSSLKSLKGIFGPRNPWPESVSSLEENLKDLENHFQEFEQSYAFTYTILSLDEKDCIGCLYIRPTPIQEFSARVDFWFIDDCKIIESDFIVWLKQWLEDLWGLDSPCFPGKTITWSEYYNLLDNLTVDCK